MPRPRKKKVTMSDPADTPAPTPEVSKSGPGETGKKSTLTIERTPDGTKLKLRFRSPLLADIVEKMESSYYELSKMDKVAHPLMELLTFEDKDKDKNGKYVLTRKGLSAATKHLVAAPDFDWEAPRAWLFYNAKALREGFELVIKPDKPIPPETVRAFGKKVMSAAEEIISNARPFRMVWNLDEVQK